MLDQLLRSGSSTLAKDALSSYGYLTTPSRSILKGSYDDSNKDKWPSGCVPELWQSFSKAKGEIHKTVVPLRRV